MPEPDLIQRQRELLRTFRQANARRACANPITKLPAKSCCVHNTLMVQWYNVTVNPLARHDPRR